jgi:hypothetical protein
MSKSNIESQSSTGSRPIWDYMFDASAGKEFADIKYDAGRIPWDVFDIYLLLIEYRAVKEENQVLRTENQRMQKELQAAQACQSDPEPVTELRDIPRKKAKTEIARFFKQHHGEVIYPSDVAEALSLNYLLVEEIIKELIDDGEIKRAAG